MEYVDPIRNIEKINEIKRKLKEHSNRDYLLFVFGINTGIRVSDLLSLKVDDIWDGTKVREFLFIEDAKSGIQQAYYLNSVVQDALNDYLDSINFTAIDYLFKSKKNTQPITRQQAYRIINHAAKEAGIPGKIGTHTLRKTFGYHAYRKGIAISILKSIYHHTTSAETLRYIGIDKNEKNLIKVDVNL